MPKHTLIITVIIVAVIVIGATAIYITLRQGSEEVKKQEEVATTTKKTTSQPEKPVAQPEEPTTTEPIDTSNWKIYRNDKYGFEVKYPKEWFIIFKEPLTLSSAPLSEYGHGGIVPQGNMEVTVLVYERPQTEFKNFIQQELKSIQPVVIASKKSLVINGLPAYQVEAEYEPEIGSDQIITFIAAPDGIFYKIITDFAKGDIGKLELRSILDKILSSFKLLEVLAGEKATFGNLTAFAMKRNNLSFMILVEDGKEIIIEKASSDVVNGGLEFSAPKFLSHGNYLVYTATGWEWDGIRIYDIKNKKIIKKLESPFMYGFTPDQKHFYACADNDLLGVKYVRVYSVPDFSVEKDLLEGEDIKGYYTIGCQYNKDKNIMRVSITEYTQEGNKKRTVDYSF